MPELLLVEDAALDARLVTRGYADAAIPVDVTHVTSGEDALALLRQRTSSTLPHALLVDIRLPGMSGIEFLQSVRSDPKLAALPVIVYTGSRLRRDKADAEAAGADFFFEKPDNVEDLFAQCRDIADRWLGVGRPPSARNG